MCPNNSPGEKTLTPHSVTAVRSVSEIVLHKDSTMPKTGSPSSGAWIGMLLLFLRVKSACPLLNKTIGTGVSPDEKMPFAGLYCNELALGWLEAGYRLNILAKYVLTHNMPDGSHLQQDSWVCDRHCDPNLTRLDCKK
jgi:hypothetical protein